MTTHSKTYLPPLTKVLRYGTRNHLMLPGTITYDDGTTVDDEAAKGGMIDEGVFGRQKSVWED